MCGDGKVQAQHGEECDDGNQFVTDACLSELHAHLPSYLEIKKKNLHVMNSVLRRSKTFYLSLKKTVFSRYKVG